MNRTEFLDTLRSQLSGQMHEGKVAAHVRYYEDYIQSQVRSGRDELQGDPNRHQQDEDEYHVRDRLLQRLRENERHDEQHRIYPRPRRQRELSAPLPGLHRLLHTLPVLIRLFHVIFLP